MREKKIFLYMAALAYHVKSEEVKSHILRQTRIFRHTCCINNPHWQMVELQYFYANIL